MDFLDESLEKMSVFLCSALKARGVILPEHLVIPLPPYVIHLSAASTSASTPSIVKVKNVSIPLSL